LRGAARRRARSTARARLRGTAQTDRPIVAIASRLSPGMRPASRANAGTNSCRQSIAESANEGRRHAAQAQHENDRDAAEDDVPRGGCLAWGQIGTAGHGGWEGARVSPALPAGVRGRSMSCSAARTAPRRPRTDHDECFPCSVGMRGGEPGVQVDSSVAPTVVDSAVVEQLVEFQTRWAVSFRPPVGSGR
jgi:hypothetical protein